MHRAVQEHVVNVGVGTVLGLPGRPGSADVQGTPDLGQELRARQPYAVVPKVEEEPTHGGGGQGLPVALDPEVLLDVGLGQVPRRVERGPRGLCDGPRRCRPFVVPLVDGAVRRQVRSLDRVTPRVVRFHLVVQGRLAKQLRRVELGLDRVIFDVEEKPGSFRDGESKQQGNHARNHTETDDPPPHLIDTACGVLGVGAPGDDDDDERDEVAGNLT